MIKGNWETRQVYINEDQLDPKQSQMVFNHSPDGFNWGYSGSGPAQLALALLLRFTRDDEIAVKYHQAFKDTVIASLPEGDFELNEKVVWDWISKNIPA